MLHQSPEVVRRHGPEILDAVASAPLFAGLPLSGIADILDRCEFREFPPGSRPLREGEPTSEVFLIVDGEATADCSGGSPLVLRAGDCFGAAALLGQGAGFGSVTAVTALRCLTLQRDELEALIREEPRIGVNLLRWLVGRFRSLGGAGEPAGAARSRSDASSG